MQNKDAIAKEYFRDKTRIADLLNGYIFEGEQIVRPENVGELDSSMARITKKSAQVKNTENIGNTIDTKDTEVLEHTEFSEVLKTQVLVRDLVRQIEINCTVVILAIENQSDIHYAMPVRVMNADSAGYDAQLREKKKIHRQRKDLERGEFLSGFGKEDKLFPIISIVLYFGKKEWDGAKNLKDMLDLSELPDKMRNFVSDYSMNLIEVRKYENLENFQSDIQQVFGFLQNAENVDKLKKYVGLNAEKLSHLEEDAYDMISVLSNSRELQQMKAICRVEKGGGYNMCQGLREWMQEEEARGEARGETRGEARGQILGEEQGIQLAKKVFAYGRMNMSPDLIAQNCGISEEKVKMILDL